QSEGVPRRRVGGGGRDAARRREPEPRRALRLHRQAHLAPRRAVPVAGAVRHRSLMSAARAFEPRRIVVVVTRQIGDVLLTTPLIAAAKARWPEASIDVLGMAGTLGVLAGHPAVPRCIDVGAAKSGR